MDFLISCCAQNYHLSYALSHTLHAVHSLHRLALDGNQIPHIYSNAVIYTVDASTISQDTIGTFIYIISPAFVVCYVLKHTPLCCANHRSTSTKYITN